MATSLKTFFIGMLFLLLSSFAYAFDVSNFSYIATYAPDFTVHGSETNFTMLLSGVDTTNSTLFNTSSCSNLVFINDKNKTHGYPYVEYSGCGSSNTTFLILIDDAYNTSSKISMYGGNLSYSDLPNPSAFVSARFAGIYAMKYPNETNETSLTRIYNGTFYPASQGPNFSLNPTSYIVGNSSRGLTSRAGAGYYTGHLTTGLTNDILTSGTGFTLSMYFNSTATIPGEAGNQFNIFENYLGDPSIAANQKLALGFFGTHAYPTVASLGESLSNSSIDIKTNTWNMYTLTYNKTNNNTRIYLNGTMIVNGTLGFSTTSTSDVSIFGASLYSGVGYGDFFLSKLEPVSENFVYNTFNQKYKTTAPTPNATNIPSPAISLNSTAFCDNFGDGGTCDHGYSANWVQIATMEGNTWENLTATTRVSNDTTNRKEGSQGFRLDATPTGSANGSDPYLAIPPTDLSAFANITLHIYQPVANNISNLWVNFHDTNNSNQFKFRLDKFGLNICPSAGWCHVNIPKASPSLTSGSPSWTHITTVEMYLTANTTGNAWATFDNLRAVKANGEFNDTANNKQIWQVEAGEWEIQNTSNGKRIVMTNLSTTGGGGYLWLTNSTGGTSNTVSANKTVYATMNLGGKTAYMYIRSYSGGAYLFPEIYYNSGNTWIYCSNGSALNLTQGCSGINCDINIKLVEQNLTASVYWKNSTMSDYSALCLGIPIPPQTKLGLASSTAAGVAFDNVLIQSHMPNATNTTDNNGIFTRGQTLEASALVEGSGEVVGDWYQDGTLNKTAPRAVAYYPFDAPNSNATYTPDLSIAGGNDANVSGATWASNGIKGGGYSFTVNDYIDTGSNFSSALDGDFTYSVWVNPSSSQSGTGGTTMIIMGGLLGSTPIISNIERYTSGSLRVCFSTLGCTTDGGTSYTIPLNTWTHIAVTRTIATGEVREYINGAFHRNYTQTGSDAPLTNSNINIGADARHAANRFWNGSIDEVYIYNQSLTADEISQLYRKGMIGSELNALGLTYSTGAVWYANFTESRGVSNTAENATLYSDVVINYAHIKNNQSLFANQTILEAMVNAENTDSTNMSIFYSWLKNGVNQTALAGTAPADSGVITYFNTTAPAFTAGDKWSLVAYAVEGSILSKTKNSTNATVQTYTVGIEYTSPQADMYSYNYSAYSVLNTTLTDTTASFNINGTYHSVSKGNNATNNTFYVANLALASGTYNATWSFNYTTIDGGVLQQNHSLEITVSDSGFFLCNSTINTTTAVYSIIDSTTYLPINATTQITYNINYGTKIMTINSTNSTIYICITPNTTFNAVTYENANMTGYASFVNVLGNKDYNYTPLLREIALTNISSGAYYTFQIQNIYAASIVGAVLTSYHLLPNGSWVFYQTQVSDSTGSAVFFLIPTTVYNFTINATGYNTLEFSFTPAATTSILAQLTQNISFTPSSFNVWNDTQYSITPNGGYYNTSQTLSYQSLSSNGSLTSWGMYILKVNGSVITTVFNQTSVVPTGGIMSYVASPTSNYALYAWFKHMNASNYTILPVFYTITNQSTGLVNVRDMLATGTVISGWAYFFLALIFAVIAGIGLYQFGGAAATIGALIVLDIFTVITPAGMYIFGGVEVWMASLLLNLGGIAALYVMNYGG